jgi:phenylalanyl-tRNA synthetase beta chain
LSVFDVRRQLVARGFHEAITYSFVDPQIQKLLHPEHEGLALLNPISSEMSVMRTSLWSGLVQAAIHNLKRQQSRVRLFETGLRFVPSADGLQQIPTLAMLVTGARLPLSWADAEQAADFFDVKGDLESLLERTGVPAEFRFVADSLPALHPGQSARIDRNGSAIGWIGALHPSVQKELGIKQPVYVIQLDLETLLEASVPSFSELSRFPEMRRDLALVVHQDVAVEQVLSGIRETAGEYLKDVTLFDLYVGKGIDPERKSLALGLTWQHPSRTLTDQEVNDSVEAVLAHLNAGLDAILRG